jgi:hypothetical protein
MSVRVTYSIGGSARIVTLDMARGSNVDDVAARISLSRRVPVQRVYIMSVRQLAG